MNEIVILDSMPIVLTKDNEWQSNTVAEPGAIIYLPEDAVLVNTEVS